MKHSIDESKLENKHLASAFIHAAFEKKQLAEQIQNLYDSVDYLGANLDIEARQILFHNTDEHMQTLAGQLVELETQLNEMLPWVLKYRESLSTELLDTTTSIDSTSNAAHSPGPIASSTLTEQIDISSRSKRITLPPLTSNKPTLVALEPAPLSDIDDDTDYLEEELPAFNDPIDDSLIEHHSELETHLEEDDHDTSLANAAENDQPTNPTFEDNAYLERIAQIPLPQPNCIPPDPAEQTLLKTPPQQDTSCAPTGSEDESWQAPPTNKVINQASDHEMLDNFTAAAKWDVTGDDLPTVNPQNDVPSTLVEDDISNQNIGLASILESEAEHPSNSTKDIDSSHSSNWESDQLLMTINESLAESTQEDHILFWKQKASDSNPLVSSESPNYPSNDSATSFPPDSLETPLDLETIDSFDDDINDESSNNFDQYSDSEKMESDPSDSDNEDDIIVKMSDDEDIGNKPLDLDASERVVVKSDTDPPSQPTQSYSTQPKKYVNDELPLSLVNEEAENENEDTLEQELFSLIEMQPEKQPTKSASKKTLVGFGHSTIEKINAISDPTSDEDNNDFLDEGPAK